MVSSKFFYSLSLKLFANKSILINFTFQNLLGRKSYKIILYSFEAFKIKRKGHFGIVFTVKKKK